MAFAVPVNVTLAPLPAQIAVVPEIVAVGRAFTTSVCVTCGAVHPTLVLATCSLITYEPAALAVKVYGPAPLPVAVIPAGQVHVYVLVGQPKPVYVAVTGVFKQTGFGVRVKSEVGLGLVVIVIVIGVPTHPLFVGVTVYVVIIGEQVLFVIALLSAAVPLEPLDPDHDQVAAAGVGVRVIVGNPPEQTDDVVRFEEIEGIALMVTLAVAVIAGQPEAAAIV
jgi:hypothetical protein